MTPVQSAAKGRSGTTYASRTIKLGIGTALVRQRRPLAGLAAVAWASVRRLRECGTGLGARASCKHSASIGLPQRCRRVPPKCTVAAENCLGACV